MNFDTSFWSASRKDGYLIAIAEERRLMYVGITRAEQTLHLSWCGKRKQGKEWRTCAPSRFIAEMNPEGDDINISGGTSDAPPDKAVGHAKLALFKALLNKV